MVTNLELQYRTLDDLISAASVDLRNFYTDGIIEIGELIKVAQRCNYQLGIQINQTKETILEIEHNRTKLPNDFQFLNFAVLCHRHREEHNDLWPRGLVHQEEILWQPDPITTANAGGLQSSVVFCWTIDLTLRPLCNDHINCGGATDVFSFSVQDASGNWTVQCFPQGQITTICAQNVSDLNQAGVTCPLPLPKDRFLIKGQGAYIINGQFSCTPEPVNCAICNTPNPAPDHCCGPATIPNCDPWNQNKVYSICDDKIGIKIIDSRGANRITEYTHFEELFMQPSRQASAFSSSQHFRTCGNQAFLRNGFLECSRECAKVYINYQGLLENEQGELLVIDHPMINEWMEYEVKSRILENLYYNGEPDLERRLHDVRTQAAKYKQEAMNIAYMPDWKVVVQTFKKERDNMNRKYIEPFSRFQGWNQNSIFFDELVNKKYRE